MLENRPHREHPSVSAPLYETAQYIEPANDECQDRIKVISDEGRKIICVVDGAGGTGDGSRAAEHVIREVENSYKFVQNPLEWRGILKSIDQNIPNGQAAAIILDLRQGSATVACVGDCEAWALFDSSIIKLSAG
jgi:serine/threonine protein phosphatase PrpC